MTTTNEKDEGPDWEAIELDFRLGVPVAQLCRDYKLEQAEIRTMAITEDWGLNDSMSHYLVLYRYKMFVDHFLATFDRVGAMRAAGYHGKRPPNLMNRPEVRVILEQRMKEMTEATDVTRHRVIKELARIAFVDPAKLFDNTGRPLPISEIDADTRAVIVGLDVADEFEGKGDQRQHIGSVKKYKLANKNGALDSLAKHLGMFIEKVEVKDVTPDKPETSVNDAARRIAFVLAQAMQSKGNTKEV